MPTTELAYRAAPGAQFNDDQAAAWGPELQALAEAEGGLSPERIVEVAEQPRSTLHGYFCWDDEEAACQHRLQQARQLVNHLVVVIRYQGVERQVKAFHSITYQTVGSDEVKHMYVTIKAVAEQPDLRKQLLAQALREIRTWRSRYQDLKELASIFRAVDRRLARSRK